MPAESIKEFLDTLASKQPVPGGGGASALVGAVGMALGSMVGELTVGKKKYAAAQPELMQLNAQARALIDEFKALMQKDEEAFLPLSRAYSLPKDDPSREDVMQRALGEAVKPPLEMMRCCCKAIILIERYAQIGSAIAISDAGVAAACCAAALKGASLNVFINTKLITDAPLASRINAEADDMLAEFLPRADAAFAGVRERL